jgi:acetyl-CoA carboxylase biotin carboxylase subunit
VYAGFVVPIEYDPLLAKLSVWAETRESAIQRMWRAVQEFRVVGIITNLGLFQRVMEDRDFGAGELHTAFLDEFMKRVKPAQTNSDALVASMLAAAHWETTQPQTVLEGPATLSMWRAEGRRGLLR